MDPVQMTETWRKFPHIDQAYTVVRLDGPTIHILKPYYRIETVYNDNDSSFASNGSATVFAHVPASEVVSHQTLSADTIARVKIARFSYNANATNIYRLLVADRIHGDQDTVFLPMVHCINVKLISETLAAGEVLPYRNLLKYVFQSIWREQNRQHGSDIKKYLEMLETNAIGVNEKKRTLSALRAHFVTRFTQRGGTLQFCPLDYQIADIRRMRTTEEAIDRGLWGINSNDVMNPAKRSIQLAPDLWADHTGSGFQRSLPEEEPWQHRHLIPINGGCLFHEAGMGKTFMALANAIIRGARDPNREYGTLILTSPNQITQWIKEIEKMAPTMKACRIGRLTEFNKHTPQTLKEFDFVVMSLEFLSSHVYTKRLRSHFPHLTSYAEMHTVARAEFGMTATPPLVLQLLPFTRLIVDEAHCLVREGRKDNLWQFVHASGRSVKYMWFLTGTPFDLRDTENNEYIRYLDFCGLRQYMNFRQCIMQQVDRAVLESDFMQNSFAIHRTFARSGQGIAQYSINRLPVQLKLSREEQLTFEKFSKVFVEVRTNQAYGVSATRATNLESIVDCTSIEELRKKTEAQYASVVAIQQGVVVSTQLNRQNVLNEFARTGIPNTVRTMACRRAEEDLAVAQEKLKTIQTRQLFMKVSVSDLADPDIRKNLSCSICMADDLPDISLLTCGHVFCPPCIGTWLATSALCPICRASTLYHGRRTTYRLRAPLTGQSTAEAFYRYLKSEYGAFVAALMGKILSLPHGEKAILYSRFRRPVDRLASILKKELKNGDKYAVFHGSVIDKEMALAKFLDSPVCRAILVAGPGAFIGGLDLQHANTVFLIDIVNSPEELTSLEQEALSRINRISRTKPIDVMWFNV